MSTPANPLDKFVTYTYHFELHAADSWDTIKQLEDSDMNAVTPRVEPNGTLLINTRKDAHQVIDDVVFSYIGPSSNQFGLFVPSGDLSMKVYEPNGASFIEKLAYTLKNNNATSPTSLMWALKIFFVGRTPDNTIIKLPENGMLIPLKFAEMESSFSYKGGEYNIKFLAVNAFSGANPNINNSESLLTGYCDRNISVTAASVKDALRELERKLNENYQNTYETRLKNSQNARPIKYSINFDPEIDGSIDIIGAESLKDGDPVKFSFIPSQTILSWIYQILRSSNTLNKMVSESLENLNKEHHEGVKFISVIPRSLLKADELEIIYDITFYKGSDRTLEFDFLFCDAGKNVDIMSFDIHMKSALAWFASNSSASVDSVTSLSGTSAITNPTLTSQNIQVEDKAQKNQAIKQEQVSIPGLSGDTAYLPSSSQGELTGHVRYKQAAVPGARQMFETVSKMHAAYDPAVTFTIRGNLDLLKSGIMYPDAKMNDEMRMPIGVLSPLWLKVNIRSPDDQITPFFYTGKYNLINIENHFSGGKFTQNLYTMMHDITDTSPAP